MITINTQEEMDSLVKDGKIEINDDLHVANGVQLPPCIIKCKTIYIEGPDGDILTIPEIKIPDEAKFLGSLNG